MCKYELSLSPHEHVASEKHELFIDDIFCTSGALDLARFSWNVELITTVIPYTLLSL